MKRKIFILVFLTIILGILIAINYNTNKVEDNKEANTISNEIIDKNNLLENKIIQNATEENTLEVNSTENQEENNTNNTISEENITYNNKESENKMQTNATVKMTLSPSGFMGSSLKKVILYSNGEVYMINYNGDGYEEKNIVSRELLAKNADIIIYKGQEEFESIIIKGKNVEKINTNYSWIEFEK